MFGKHESVPYEDEEGNDVPHNPGRGDHADEDALAHEPQITGQLAQIHLEETNFGGDLFPDSELVDFSARCGIFIIPALALLVLCAALVGSLEGSRESRGKFLHSGLGNEMRRCPSFLVTEQSFPKSAILPLNGFQFSGEQFHSPTLLLTQRWTAFLLSLSCKIQVMTLSVVTNHQIFRKLSYPQGRSLLHQILFSFAGGYFYQEPGYSRMGVPFEKSNIKGLWNLFWLCCAHFSKTVRLNM